MVEEQLVRIEANLNVKGTGKGKSCEKRLEQIEARMNSKGIGQRKGRQR